MARDEAPKADGAAELGAATPPGRKDENVQVTIEHAVKHDTVLLTVPSAATVHEVLEILASTLGRPELCKNGRIVKKNGQAFVSMKGTEKLGKKRHLLIMGVDNLEGTLVPLEQALKMHAPGNEPQWALQQAIKMQEELNKFFAEPEFQRKLQELEWLLLPREIGQYTVERQLLCLDVQKAVLPKYGFEGSERGVRDMMKACEGMSSHSEAFFKNMLIADRLLRIPAADSLGNRWQFIVAVATQVGVSEKKVADDLSEEIGIAAATLIAAAAERAAGKATSAASLAAALSPTSPPAAKANSTAVAPPPAPAPAWRGPSLAAVRTPEPGEVLVVRTSQQGRERLAPLAPLRLLTGSSAAQRSSEACVVVEPGTKFQTFLGFGGSFTESSAELLQGLGQPNQERVIDACFSADSGLGYRLGRMHINSCDFSTGNWSCCQEGDMTLSTFGIGHYEEAILPMLRRAAKAAGGGQRPLRLVASPWSPPGWMKDTGRMCDGGRLLPECRAAWAQFYVKFAYEMEAAGLPLWALSVQNEPMASTGWENCLYSAEEERDFVRDFLGPALWSSGLDLKLLIWDHNRDQMFARARTVYADEEAARYVWGAAFHWYGDPRYEKWPDKAGQLCFDNVGLVHELRPDKHLIMTEACQEGGPHKGEWSLGERYAESIIKDLNNWTEGWIDWNLLLDEKGGPNHVGNYCSAPILVDVNRDLVLFQSSYYFIGHFSRYIRPGARRLLCAASRDALEVTAFENVDGTIAVVVLNQSEVSMSFHLDVGGRETIASAPKHSISTFLTGKAVSS